MSERFAAKDNKVGLATQTKFDHILYILVILDMQKADPVYLQNYLSAKTKATNSNHQQVLERQLAERLEVLRQQGKARPLAYLKSMAEFLAKFSNE